LRCSVRSLSCARYRLTEISCAYVEDGGQAMPELLRVLDSEHIGIKSMSLSEPTLDDVFLRQTGRSLRDTGENEGAAHKTEVAA
jgi:hypothetical protein